MKRRFRLRSSIDFQRVRRFGKSYAHPLVVLIALPNQLEITRFGFAAGRSVGKAVQRNRAKRLMRAAVSMHISTIGPGWDLVLIARRPMAEASFSQTQTAISDLLHRAHLLMETYDI